MASESQKVSTASKILVPFEAFQRSQTENEQVSIHKSYVVRL